MIPSTRIPVKCSLVPVRLGHQVCNSATKVGRLVHKDGVKATPQLHSALSTPHPIFSKKLKQRGILHHLE